MKPTPRRNFLISLRYVALLVVLAGLGVAVFTFTANPDHMFASQANSFGMRLSTWGKSSDGRVPTPAEQRRVKLIETGRIIAGGCVIGFLTVGVIRVIKSWKRSLA